MKSVKMRLFLFYFLLATLMAAVSCGDSGKVRKYKEKAPPAAQTQQASQKSPGPGAGLMPAHAHFQWDTPEGWNENRASSGFRLAAFTIKSGDKESICTIIPLQGEAGGLKANVTRWLGQVTGAMKPDPNAVNQLLKAQEKFLTKGQFPAVMIDFTPVTPNPTNKSILAAVITVQGNSVFIKMTGEKSHLIENKAKFKALCQSFTL
ncbi:MAG: hypothetical protein JSV88_06225 [Candidatus Aminicenantes bacterium]|nr:MAG: hypothetical protein JSV88_06225 [Candidatus Aminicenantes bacterium]